MRATRLSSALLLILAAGICLGADDLEIGLSGQRMRENPMRRGVNGAKPYAHAGEVAVGKLAVKSGNAKEEKDAELGLRVLDVATEIDGLSARTTVTHVFQNSTDELLEGVFSFALPAGAAVDRFAMTIHSESDLMEGELMEKSQAKNIYSNLVYGVGIDPGVLEWVDGNLFRATIFPIPAKGSKTIVVSYLESLTPKRSGAAQATTYRYPLFQRGDNKRMPPAAEVRLHTVVRNTAPGTGIRATLNPKVKSVDSGATMLSVVLDSEITSPEDWMVTLQTNLPAQNDGLVIAAKNAAPALSQPNGPAADPNACIFRAHRSDTKVDGSFALTLIPDAPHVEQPKEVDVIFMLDTSSSRSRASMAASCELIRASIETLNLKDRFALVCFDVTTRVLSGGLQEPFERNVDRAMEMLNSSLPMGATDVAGAFKTVEDLFARTARPNTYIVYLGDADASFGVTDKEAVGKKVEHALSALHADIYAVYSGPRANVTVNAPVVGNGAAVVNVPANAAANAANAPVKGLDLHAQGLEALAKLTGGPVVNLSQDVRPADAGRSLIHSLGAPVLSRASLEVTADDGTQLECTPPIAGGITLNSAITAFGRYAKVGKATASLSGMIKGEFYRRAWTVEFPKQELANAAVEKLWARAHIGHLNTTGVAQDNAEAMRLALKYGILSQNTAFLVLESEKLYADYRIARAGRKLAPNELRSRLLAGTPTPSEAAPGDASAVQLAAQSMRIAEKPQLANSTTGVPVTIGTTKVKCSLQDVKIVERPDRIKAGDPVLSHREALERRIALSRLIAFERGLPFEPETVFPKLWLEALDNANAQFLFANNEATTGGKRDDVADDRVWSVVQKQLTAAPASWRSKVQPADPSEEQIDRLQHPDKVSQIKISDDSTAIYLDSHLFAHQILGDLLMDNAPKHYKHNGGPSEVLRVIGTRRALTYSLKGVTPERLCAAWNFLAQLALVEHQPEIAEQFATRAIDVSAQYAASGQPLAALSHMILGVTAQVSGDYKGASKQYAAMLAGTDRLMKGSHGLTYGALVTTMALGGNLDGVISVLERWCSESYSPEIAVRLGEAYLLAHRRDDAIRALSMPLEFGQDNAADFARPEDFLKKTRKTIAQ